MKRLLAYVATGIVGMMALSATAGGTYVEYVDSDYNQKTAINTGYFVNPKTGSRWTTPTTSSTGATIRPSRPSSSAPSA